MEKRCKRVGLIGVMVFLLFFLLSCGEKNKSVLINSSSFEKKAEKAEMELALFSDSDIPMEEIVDESDLDQTIIVFKEPVIEKAVRNMLNKPYGSISALETFKITQLKFSYSLSGEMIEINTLEDLKYFFNLTVLDLSGCKILSFHDMEELAGLYELKELVLSDAGIIDISAISNLKKLEYLDLSNNKISDIDVLQFLHNLVYLDLTNNEIYSVEALSGLIQLQQLYLDNNKIDKIDALSELIYLTELMLDCNKIVSVEPLQKLLSVSELTLSDNDIADITALRNLTELTWLALSNNKLTTIAPLFQMSKLQSLYLDGNQIKEFGVLGQITALKSLKLDAESAKYCPDFENVTVWY